MTVTVFTGGAAITVTDTAPPPPPIAPTITNMTVMPGSLPVGGGQVLINANVSGPNVVVTLKVDGVDKGPVTLPLTYTLT